MFYWVYSPKKKSLPDKTATEHFPLELYPKKCKPMTLFYKELLDDADWLFFRSKYWQLRNNQIEKPKQKTYVFLNCRLDRQDITLEKTTKLEKSVFKLD